MKTNYIIILLAVIAAIILYFKVFKRLKMPQTTALTVVTGGVKSGKTAFSVALAVKELKRQRRSVYLYKALHFVKYYIFKTYYEMPLLYSNVPLSCEYVPLTTDLILRKKRFNYHSVILVDEASLLADSMLYKDTNINNQLLTFNKLIGHELHGGKIIYNTQSLQDLHFSIKRCASNYFYIHHCYKSIFGIMFSYREMLYSDDNTLNTIDSTLEDCFRFCLAPNVFKTYDSYCYSVLTDDLPNEEDSLPKDKYRDLKQDYIVTFNKSIVNERKKENE